jgi:hypothetical protein
LEDILYKIGNALRQVLRLFLYEFRQPGVDVVFVN